MTHREIQMRWAVLGIASLTVGFVIMLIMRASVFLQWCGFPPFIQADVYNAGLGLHGTLMIFGAAIPLLLGAIGYEVVTRYTGHSVPFRGFNQGLPVMMGMGLLLVVASGTRLPQAGWTQYPPLSLISGDGQLFLLMGISIIVIAILGLSITISCGLGPHLRHLPLIGWTFWVAAALTTMSLPPFLLGCLMQIGTYVGLWNWFFPQILVVSGQLTTHSSNGNPLIWQHLFWFMGHPIVYVAYLPVVGIMRQILSREYLPWQPRLMMGSTIAVGILSVWVWVHHMYWTGVSTITSLIFQFSTFLVSIPTATLLIGTALMITHRPRKWSPVLVLAIGWLPLSGLGGLFGILLGFVATNLPFHDTMAVVGHFHLMLAGGTVLAIMAAIYCAFEILLDMPIKGIHGYLHAIGTLVGFALTFGTLIVQGALGIPRRYPDGGLELGVFDGQVLHGILALGIVFIAVSQIIGITGIVRSWKPGQLKRLMADNPTTGPVSEIELFGRPMDHLKVWLGIIGVIGLATIISASLMMGLI